MGGSKFRNVIMLVAGGYLCYLGGKIIRDGFIGGGMQGKLRFIGLIISIVFIVFGVGVIIRSVRHLFMDGTNDQTEEQLEQTDAAGIPEEAVTDPAAADEDSQYAQEVTQYAGENVPYAEEDPAEAGAEAAASLEAPVKRDLRWNYDNSQSQEDEPEEED